MPGGASSILDFSSWDGTPFFEGKPAKGRHVYVVKKENGAFLAYGVVEPAPRYVFQVRGSTTDEQERFLAQVEREGAVVTFGLPPFETKTGGDKPPTSSDTPVGIKGDKAPTPTTTSTRVSDKSGKGNKPVRS
ncbi:hypothetical protein BO221_16490 [Archangium sp. Cb G35]|uniref:hypothetical protein n=1 Tax=Archangium sp. Cb G35 TaxID=1920190 RepID=UPI0009361207|nr:hypothetical protein [Archangium sp. Cb G35]OJT23599.1 hypothetical protein BO221_16490 [Archangium sp. Cb G35]